MKQIGGLLFLLFFKTISFSQSATEFYKLAAEKYKYHDYHGALTAYTLAIEQNSNSAILYSNRGVCNYELGKYNEAIADYNQAIDISPTFVHAYFNKGNSYLALFEYDKALFCYNKTLKLDAGYTKAHINRAKTYYHISNYSAALKDINIAIQQKEYENDKRLFLERGNILTMLNKFDEAMSDYHTALRLDSSYFKAYINRGKLYIKLKKHKMAIADFTTAISLDNANGEGYYYRGVARIDLIRESKQKTKDQLLFKNNPKHKKLSKFACSDFKRAASLNFHKADLAIQAHCK